MCLIGRSCFPPVPRQSVRNSPISCFQNLSRLEVVIPHECQFIRLSSFHRSPLVPAYQTPPPRSPWISFTFIEHSLMVPIICIGLSPAELARMFQRMLCTLPSSSTPHWVLLTGLGPRSLRVRVSRFSSKFSRLIEALETNIRQYS